MFKNILKQFNLKYNINSNQNADTYSRDKSTSKTELALLINYMNDPLGDNKLGEILEDLKSKRELTWFIYKYVGKDREIVIPLLIPMYIVQEIYEILTQNLDAEFKGNRDLYEIFVTIHGVINLVEMGGGTFMINDSPGTVVDFNNIIDNNYIKYLLLPGKSEKSMKSLSKKDKYLTDFYFKYLYDEEGFNKYKKELKDLF